MLHDIVGILQHSSITQTKDNETFLSKESISYSIVFLCTFLVMSISINFEHEFYIW